MLQIENCKQDNDRIFATIINLVRQHNNVEKCNNRDKICLDYRKMNINEQDAFRYICGYISQRIHRLKNIKYYFFKHDSTNKKSKQIFHFTISLITFLIIKIVRSNFVLL